MKAYPKPPETLFQGFYYKSQDERRETISKTSYLSNEETQSLTGKNPFFDEYIEQMIENTIGNFTLPLGVCVNLKVNQNVHCVPMVTEESSVIAAACYGAKLLHSGRGIQASSTASEMIGQIQLLDAENTEEIVALVNANKDILLACAASFSSSLSKRGGGPKDIEVRVLPPLDESDPLGTMIIVHLIVDVCDVMGANIVNTMCEGVAPLLEKITGCRSQLRILSNLSDRRLVTVSGFVPFEILSKKGCFSEGKQIAEGIQEASVFAERDPYRATTHNKGIMNGIDAVLLATGQDTRAIEAGAHAYASQKGRYTALSRWRVTSDGLEGCMTLPMAVGTVGGALRIHPTAQTNLKIMKVQSAGLFAEIIASVGLAQNLAALRALATDGIQKGHMRLHARNVAVEAGAQGNEVILLAEAMFEERRVTLQQAHENLEKIRKTS